MNKQNSEILEEKALAKEKRRARKKPKMKVSGSSVKNLARILQKKK